MRGRPAEGAAPRPRRRRLRRILLALLVLFVALQLVPLDRSNPPVVADFDGAPEVEAVLRESCYDCHSNETTWTWTAYLAPGSWLVVRDVHRARDAFNLSEWGQMDAEDREELPEKMVEKVSEGEMPLPMYVRFHPGARITNADLTTLVVWAGTEPEEGEAEGDEEAEDERGGGQGRGRGRNRGRR
ncbi:MAG TPA: heme-binding domain-containing protein [Rubricoccaceae bacterium]|nr:heme-binding domain-containing protein [Rubricoccaceae bacterium]